MQLRKKQHTYERRIALPNRSLSRGAASQVFFGDCPHEESSSVWSGKKCRAARALSGRMQSGKSFKWTNAERQEL
jgi:hypothetical protein